MPINMGLDPIGTPKKTGSIASSANGLYGLGSLNGLGGFGVYNGSHGCNGLNSTFATSNTDGASRFFGNLATSASIATSSSSDSGDSSVAHLWERYDQLKNSDVLKNSLLEEVLTRYSYLQQQHNKLVQTVEQARGRPQSSDNEQSYLLAAQKLQSMLERDAFMLVLIDGDGMIFQNAFLRLGESGGRQAADLLKKSVDQWARANLVQCPSDFRIVARVFANAKGLAETCRRAGIVSSPEIVEDFLRGFTTSHDHFNFVDVGPGKDRADVKMNAEFKAHIYNFQCRHIFFGCSHDNGFARLLENYMSESEVVSRVTLLQGVPFEKELVALPYHTKKFDGIFRETKINLNMLDLLTDMPRLRQDSKSTFNPASGIFTPGTRTPAPNTPTFSPRSGPGFPSPAPLARCDLALTRTNSIASSNAISDTAAVPAGSGSGGGMWANIARTSAHLPLQDLTRVSLEAKSTGPVIRRNKAGQRLDAEMPYNHDRVFELKKQKFCNQHYIGKGCCHWEANNGACPHKHETKLSKDDMKWLKVVARETVCKKGTGCNDFDCIYGHHCPYPKMMEGSLRGSGCINGDNCRFSREMHSMDLNCATVHRPAPLH